MAGTQGQVTFRIYFTETSGAVLGANFMSGKNVIFDPQGESISLCVSVYLSVLFVLTVFLSVLMVEQAAESGSRSHRVASKT